MNDTFCATRSGVPLARFFYTALHTDPPRAPDCTATATTQPQTTLRLSGDIEVAYLRYALVVPKARYFNIPAQAQRSVGQRKTAKRVQVVPEARYFIYPIRSVGFKKSVPLQHHE